LCEREGVSHLVTVDDGDPFEAARAGAPFDLVIADGGFMEPASRKPFFGAVNEWLQPRGFAAFADAVYTTEQLPSTVIQAYGEPKKRTLREEAYRELARGAGLEPQYAGLSPPSNWDNYYGHIAKRMADTAGYFGSGAVKAAMDNEIRLFYRLECLKYMGYLICICRRG
jgi:hypothetical protein